MTANWIFLAIAAAFVVVALALVLTPLFRRKPPSVKVGRRNINIAVYRDQMREMEVDRAAGLITDDQFQAAKVELEARLAQDAVEAQDSQPVSKRSWKLGSALAVLIPVAAVGLYVVLGNPAALHPQATSAVTSRDIQAMLQAAEAKVKANPDDAQTWRMLARAYSVLNDWPNAIRAFKNVVRLTPNDASAWSHYGEAIALANGRDLNGEPMAMVQKALALDPKDIKALELSGIHAYLNKDYKGAVKYWQQVVELSPPGEQYTRDMQSALDKARELAGEAQAGQSLDNLSAFDAKAAAAPGKGLSGTVSIAPSLKDKVGPGDVVFLFARDAKAGPAPLAAIRLDAASLPAPFTLNDSQAMTPGNPLSSHDRVTLVARVSKTGNVMPQPGDLEGEIQSVKVGSDKLKLVIDRVRN